MSHTFIGGLKESANSCASRVTGTSKPSTTPYFSLCSNIVDAFLWSFLVANELHFPQDLRLKFKLTLCPWDWSLNLTSSQTKNEHIPSWYRVYWLDRYWWPNIWLWMTSNILTRPQVTPMSMLEHKHLRYEVLCSSARLEFLFISHQNDMTRSMTRPGIGPSLGH